MIKIIPYIRVYLYGSLFEIILYKLLAMFAKKLRINLLID